MAGFDLQQPFHPFFSLVFGIDFWVASHGIIPAVLGEETTTQPLYLKSTRESRLFIQSHTGIFVKEQIEAAPWSCALERSTGWAARLAADPLVTSTLALT